MENLSLEVLDGQTLKGFTWKAKKPIGHIVIFEGMEEHVSRYDGLAKFLNENGYSVSGFDDDRSIEAKWAVKDDVINVKFYEFDSLQNAIKDYNSIEQEWNTEANNVFQTKVSNTAGNYATVSMTFDGKYKYLCRVDKTLLRIDTDEEHKDEAKELVKKLGY